MTRTLPSGQGAADAIANRSLTFSLTSKAPAKRAAASAEGPNDPLPTYEDMMTALTPYAPVWSNHFLGSFETAADSMALDPLEAMAMAVAAWTASVHSTVPRI